MIRQWDTEKGISSFLVFSGEPEYVPSGKKHFISETKNVLTPTYGTYTFLS
jgi:hypothetical protein